MNRILLSLLAACSLVLPALAQRAEPASPAELAWITERGRMLHRYAEAVRRADDAWAEVRESRDGRTVVARLEEDRWIVTYGLLDTVRDVFAIERVARQTDDTTYRIARWQPALPDSGWYRDAARAIAVATRDFKGIWASYDALVTPGDSSGWDVYFVPTKLDPDYYVLGADARYRVSDAGAIVERRRLHRRVWEFPPDSLRSRGIEPVQGVHTNLLDDAPTETDVLHVLERLPQVDEIVVTKRWIYRIGIDGRAVYVATADRYFGGSRKKKSTGASRNDR